MPFGKADDYDGLYLCPLLVSAGWFYHAPAKRDPDKARVDYAPPSKLPGMGFDDPDLLKKDTLKEMVFKETDSEYIRLAKMGGRKGLIFIFPLSIMKVFVFYYLYNINF